jgi:hypothetical protein
MLDMIRKSKGKSTTSPIKHLTVNNTPIDNVIDICNVTASTFSHNSSSDRYIDEFERHKTKCERSEPGFTSDNSENYNSLFTLKELKDAVHKAHDTTAGPDDVHYQMLKHLPDESILALLNIFNNIWITGQFPCR